MMMMMMETTTKEEGLGFEITELRLGLPGAATTTTTTTGSGSTVTVEKPDKKRSFSEFLDDENSSSTDWKNHNKNQIVGWPPVCSYRKKNINVHLLEKNGSENTKMYVKIAMDGAPYLRKIDLSAYEDYSDLAVAFEKLFGCFGIGGVWKDCDSSEYIPIYEDKDHDWMLVGDVPWKMFVESCKRLRIMKRSDAKGFGLQSKNSDKV